VTGPPLPTLRPALSGAGGRLVVDLGATYRCVSCAVLGGGFGWVRSWLNLEVERPYTRTDPEVHLLEESADLAAPVVGMLTAARVAGFRRSTVGGATSVTTVGVGHALAAAATRPRVVPATAGARVLTVDGSVGGTRPPPRAPGRPGAVEQAPPARAGGSGGLPAVGTINLLVVVDEPLTNAGLVNALQTAVEAKAQALAAAKVVAANAAGWATGTATDSVCVACPPGERVPFAGPVTRVGAELALAVLEAVRSGAELDRAAAAAAVRAR
jgi:adenosylcobinamide hydrolase